MKQEKTKVNQDLRKEVLAIIDELYNEFHLNNPKSDNIAIQIIDSLAQDYNEQNCSLGEIYTEDVIPYLKKLDENQRLNKVKELLTNGYIDIKKYRIHMRFKPYLNYDRNKEENEDFFMNEITQ
jgi:hypothetical protein